MARLLIKTSGLENRTLELRLGVNRVGRDPDSDFPILHPTISTNHCELVVTEAGVILRDCNSTNGTFLNGDPIREAWLLPGQEVKLGDVELFVENTDITVSIPQYERERPKPPVVLADGAMICPRHSKVPASYQCTHCNEIMCSACVHIMRIKGSPPLFLCPLCSHKCVPIRVDQPKKKRGFIGFLQDTVKLRFRHTATSSNSGK
ncbi:MAG TPA: FHA domain-containing protein [Verrucomicrobiae bacterium]|nr:FHA domain-containing protein [Verrucomicrobiae bacterium]